MKFLPLAVALAASLFAAAPPQPAGPRLPRPAGGMVFDSAAGKISMDKYKGKVTVLMFFHTECDHCTNTAKQLVDLQKLRRNDFAVVGIALDDVPQQAVATWAQKNRITFPVGWTGKDNFFKAIDMPSNTKPFVPVLLFIDKDFEVNRQYQQNHPFFSTGEQRNTAGVVDMLARTAPGKAKELPRTQTAPSKK